MRYTGLDPEIAPYLQAVFRAYPDAKLLDITGSDGVVRRFGASEHPFRFFGSEAHSRGWPVIPQQRNGTRKPGKIRGQLIRWGEFLETGVADADHAVMVKHAARDNVAMVLGKGETPALRVRVIDIDVYDAFRSQQVVNLAIQHLGYTPMQRQGHAPKWALFYVEATNPSRPMRNRKFSFETNSAAATEYGSKDGIEILAGGSLITIYGYHHRTQKPFYWPVGKEHSEPLTAGPETLPEIDADKIDAFLKAVHEIDRLAGFDCAGAVSAAFDQIEFDPTLRIATPGHRQKRGVWLTRGGQDLIIDGRKEWTLERTLGFVLTNAAHIRAGGDAMAAIKVRCVNEALRYVERTGDWHTDAAIVRRVGELFDRTARKLCDGEFRERPVFVDKNGKAFTQPEGILSFGAGDRDLDYIKPVRNRRRRVSNVLNVTGPDETLAKRRALLSPDDRIVLGQSIAARIDSAIRGVLTKLWDIRDLLAHDPGYLDEVAAAEDDKERAKVRRSALKRAAAEAMQAISLLKTPTGSGKTTASVRIIREIVQTRGSLGVAIGFMLPSHANIAEVSGVAMEQADPETINAIWDEVLREASGLSTMAWKGKILSGCAFSEQMQALYAAGLSGSGLCFQRVKNALGEYEDVHCPMRDRCAAMMQLDLVGIADIVFLPHAYLTLPIPKQMREAVGALFIDESFWRNIAQTALLPMESLRLPRKEPRLTKLEKKAGVTAQDLIMERDEAAEIVTRSLIAGKCPAQTLYEFSAIRRNGHHYRGRDLAASAKDVCGRAETDGLAVRPGMTMPQVERLTANPSSKDLWLEKRLWSIVLERIGWLEADAAERKRCETNGLPFDEDNRRAKHDIELAIQYRPEHDMPGGAQDVIRLSWLRDMNFRDLPLVLLDASADEEILKVLFPGRKIEATVIDEPLHLRVVLISERATDQSMLPGGNHRDREGRLRAAETLEEVRQLAGRVGMMNSETRVLVASTKAVRKEMTTEWNGPANIDFAHYGAMAGLDFAKQHGAMICIGRMTSPGHVVSGYVAAFARQCVVPEMPYDKNGTGLTDDGRDLKAFETTRDVAMRNGGTVTLKDWAYPETMRWHNRINRQFREEETRQAIGRLRPVYRTDKAAPVVFLMQTCVPEGIIVDDVVTLSDILADNPQRVDLAEITHRLGGVLDPLAGDTVARDIGSPRLIAEAIAAMSKREAVSMYTAQVWEDGATESREVRFAPWVSDIGAALANAARMVGRELDRFEVSDIARIDQTCKAKAADALDRALCGLANADTATIEEIRAARADQAMAALENAWDLHGDGRVKVGDRWTSLAVAVILARLPAELRKDLDLLPDVEMPKPPPRVAAQAA